MVQRVSLTKLDRQSAAGLELIALCESATDDGHLSDAEIGDLREWVVTYADAPLPARSHLDATLARVLADGVITDDERAEVFAAVEKVLPPDLRAIAKGRRKQRIQEDRRATEPLDEWDFMVAGCRYEGRGPLIQEHARVGDRVFLVRDHANAHSRDAVEVRLGTGHHIGFVPETIAADVAEAIDRGPYIADIKKVLTGGRAPIPVIVASAYDQDTTVAGVQRQHEAPPRSRATANTRVGQPARARDSRPSVRSTLVYVAVAAVIVAGLLVLL
jgi:hypothetical protein